MMGWYEILCWDGGGCKFEQREGARKTSGCGRLTMDVHALWVNPLNWAQLVQSICPHLGLCARVHPIGFLTHH